MRTTFNINFVCRPSKVTKSGKAPIEMSIIINGARTIISLPSKADPKEFKKAITSKRVNPIKDYINQIYQKVIQTQSDLLREGIAVTPQTIKDRLLDNNSYTISDLFEDFLKIQKKRMSAPVFRRYELVRDMFCQKINPKKQVTEITNAIVSDFYTELNNKYESTTAAGMIAKLKTVVKFGLDNNKLKINPFNGIKIHKKTKEVEFLTESEIKTIKEKNLNGRLAKVRDLFVFQCFTGLAYVDMANLTPEDYQMNGNQIYIKKARQKTGVTFTTVLFDEAAEIVKRYNFQLPVLSNQKYNSYLKEIADVCGISKSMHTHIGRHTFCTLMLNKGLSIEVVAKMAGHSNTKQTLHYAKMLDKTVFEAVNQIKRD